MAVNEYIYMHSSKKNTLTCKWVYLCCFSHKPIKVHVTVITFLICKVSVVLKCSLGLKSNGHIAVSEDKRKYCEKYKLNVTAKVINIY